MEYQTFRPGARSIGLSDISKQYCSDRFWMDVPNRKDADMKMIKMAYVVAVLGATACAPIPIQTRTYVHK